MVDQAALALRMAGQQHLLNDLRQGGGRRAHRPGQRIATQGAEPHALQLRRLARLQRHPLVIDHEQGAIPLDHRPLRRQIQRHDGDVFQVDVLPDVQFGPVGQREHPDALALVDPAVVEVPQFGTLVFRVPAMVAVAEGINPLLGPRALLVAPGAAKSRVEAVLVQSLLQRLGFHHVGVDPRAVGKRVDALAQAVFVDVDDQFQTQPLRLLVAKADHLPEFPGGIDMHQRKRRLTGIKGFQRQLQHHRGILPDRVQHHRLLELGGHLANDVNAFGFELLQMSQFVGVHERHFGQGYCPASFTSWMIGRLTGRL